MDKRGQSGATLTEVIIALAIVVFVLYAIYYAYSQYTSTAQYLSDDLTPLAFACNSYAALGDTGKIAYCITPRAIKYGRETRYVNCEFNLIKPFITDKSLEESCDKVSSFSTMCTTLQANLGNNFKTKAVCVNDVRCTASGGKDADCSSGTVSTTPTK